VSDLLVIKRNRNRRLYSPGAGRYITLADVDQLIQDGTPFQVINTQDETDTAYLTLIELLKERAKAGQMPIAATC
jgi:polyhydroxyalkanoate synthesis regulator protein